MRRYAMRSKSKAEGQHGIALLYVIGVLVILGAVAAGITVLTPSSTITELNENKFGQAYYSAYSGLQYLKYGEKGIYENVSGFIDAINSGSPYVLNSGNSFEVKISPDGLKENSYIVDYLIGNKIDNGVNVDKFLLASNFPRSFEKSISKPKNLLDKVYSADTRYILTNDTYTSNSVSASDIVLNDRAYVAGNIVSNSSVFLSNDSKLNGYVCAKTTINVNDRASISMQGAYADGDVTLQNDSTVSGPIVTKGNLILKDRAHAADAVYVGNSIVLYNDSKVDSLAQVVKNVSINERVTASTGINYGNFINYNYTPAIKLVKVNASDIKFPVYDDLCATTTYPKHQVACDAGAVNIYTNNAIIDATSRSSYNNIALQNDWNLTIKSGTYCINSLSTNDRGSLIFDLSGGDINLFINGNVRLANDTKIFYIKESGGTPILFNYGTVPTSATSPGRSDFIDKINKDIAANGKYYSKVYIETLGNFDFNDRIAWFGTIYSAGTINLSNRLVLIGAFYAHNDSNTAVINNKDGVYAFYLMSNYAAKNWK